MTVFVVGILAPLVLSAQVIAFSQASKNRLIAAGLAQEGVELVRNLRDQNVINETNVNQWDGLNSGGEQCIYRNCFKDGIGYKIDARSMSFIQPGSDLDELYLVPFSAGKMDCNQKDWYEYLEQPGGALACAPRTIFTRTIWIGEKDKNCDLPPGDPFHRKGDDPIQVCVKVDWRDHELQRSVTVVSVLYNWQR